MTIKKKMYWPRLRLTEPFFSVTETKIKMTQHISIFKGVKDTKGSSSFLGEVIAYIQGTESREATEKLRASEGEAREKIKRSMMAATWSAKMNGAGRTAKNVETYSGLICLDIDKLTPEQLAEYWEKIIADPHTYFSFISPSGNGIKVVMAVTGGPENHGENFKALESYFKQKGITVDPSGKDVNRLCFLPHDPDLYFNPNYVTFEPPPPSTKTVKKAKAAPPPPSENELDTIYKFTENKLSNIPGNGNNFIYLFASNCNRRGIDISECLTYAIGFSGNRDVKETAATVESAYKHHEAEHGKYKNEKPLGKLPSRTGKAFSHGNNDGDYFTQFWFVTVTTDKNGKDKTTLDLSYRLLIQFLSENGYYRLPMGENGYELVHYESNIVKRVQAFQVRDFVVKWAADKNMWALEEKLRRSGKTALSNDQINTLPFLNIEFKTDTPNEAFFYFKNCWVQVNAKGISTFDYEALDKAIWATQIKPREFTIEKNWLFDITNPDSFTCEYAKFLYLASHNPKGDESQDIKFRIDRFNCFCTSFGYLLHSFKNPSNAKMILSIDHKIGEKGEQNGGSGKSLAGKAVAELKHTTNISGKDFKEDYPFKYEQVTPDSQLVCFNDLRRSFNIECLFEIITGDFTVNRRNIGYLVLPFASSPKVYANTNFIPPGEGSSFLRRVHVLEFSDYFTEEHTPFDEFGHTLFQDWDSTEWNRFYNFMLQNCVSLYLEKGLVKYPGSNFDQRKLQSEVPEEFIDFLDQVNENGTFVVARNVCHNKVKLLDNFREFSKGTGLKDPTANSFTRWIKKYCKTKGYTWNKHMNGKRDSSGPMGEFISICDKDFDHEKCISTRGVLFNAHNTNR